MSPARLEDEEKRHDEHGQGAVEVYLLLSELGAKDGQRGEVPDAFLGWMLTRKR